MKSMFCVALIVLLCDLSCDGAGVRRLTRRRKVLPTSGLSSPSRSKKMVAENHPVFRFRKLLQIKLLILRHLASYFEILTSDLVAVARQNTLPEGVVVQPNGLPRRRRVKIRRPLALQLPPVSPQTSSQHLQIPSQSLQAPIQYNQPPSASLQAPPQPLASLQAPTVTPFDLRPENRPFQVNETVGSKPEFAKRCELA